MCFSVKPKILVGDESLDIIKKFNKKKIFIVCDPFVVQNRMIDSITDLIDGSSCFQIFDNIKPDPTSDLVAKALDKMQAFATDIVISIGGGSAIDTAKAMIYEIKKGNNEEIPFVVIPTTAGTGSEVTNFAVISYGNFKKVLIDDVMLADYALLVPKFTKTVPNFITADTGMDVITHALEAYVSKKANDFTDVFCEKAVELVFENLKRVYDDGDLISLRRKMLEASCMAGIAFNCASLGINHSLAHIIGGKFHISHGRINAILLPHVIGYNAKNSDYAKEKYNKLAVKLGLDDYTDLIAKIKELSSAMNIEKRLKDLGRIDEIDYKKSLSEMADIAMLDRCTPTNPALVTKFDLRNILKDVF